jgi:pilus assembly protein Flp/PilA
MKHLKKLIGNESGATAIEYGMIVALISVGIIVSVDSIGNKLAAAFLAIDTRL